MIISLYGQDGTGKTETSLEINKTLPNSYLLKSTTTRENRDNNNDYNHVTKKQFESKIENGEFIEWAIFNNEYYGLEKVEIEGNLHKEFLIYIGESNGIYNLDNYMQEALPQIDRIKILMDIPTEVVIKNLRDKNFSEEYIEKRVGRSTVLEDAKKLNIEPDLTVVELNSDTVNKVVAFIFKENGETIEVKIKTLKSMLEEFGYDNEEKVIPCELTYSLYMEDFIPSDRIIKISWDKEDNVFRLVEKEDWQISTDMIEER